MHFSVLVEEGNYVLGMRKLGLLFVCLFVWSVNEHNTLAASKHQPAQKVKRKAHSVSLNSVKAWDPLDKNCPQFDEDQHEVAKMTILQVNREHCCYGDCEWL